MQRAHQVALVEVAGCVFDAEQLALAHGYKGLDPVSREAFVNHLHLTSGDRVIAADLIIASWIAEMKARWPGRVFRIYRDLKSDEVIYSSRSNSAFFQTRLGR
jgi:hypothetical protein